MSIDYLLNDNQRGATAIYRDALLLMRAQPVEEILEVSHNLVRKLRIHFPVMGLFFRLENDILSLSNPVSVLDLLDVRINQLGDLIPDIAQHSVMGIEGVSRMMTISNSQLTIAALAAYHQKRPLEAVFVLRSGPANEGELMAAHLTRYQIPSVLIDDEEMSAKMKSADGCIVGCDLLSEEYFINKTGTGELVTEAFKQDRPVWVVADDLRYIQAPVLHMTEGSLFEIIPYMEGLQLITNNGYASVDNSHSIPGILINQ